VKGQAFMEKETIQPLETLNALPFNRDVWYNIANTEWRVCEEINGRIRSQTLRGEV